MACATCGGEHREGTPCATLIREGPPARAADPLIGAQLGQFRIKGRIGGGGMGSVYLGEHARIGSHVAIKFLHPHLASNAALVDRFYAEARAVNLIGHPNIVNVIDIGVLPPDRHFLVMEYLEGCSLESLPRPVAAEVALPILEQVCDALEAAHGHGVVHRDLKPENVFLLPRGHEGYLVKLLDFGIAKLLSSPTQLTSAGMLLGTPEYMSPEQCLGGAIDGRSDLYSVGVMSFLLSTGRLPFVKRNVGELLMAHLHEPPPDPREINPELGEGWPKWTLRALSKEPEGRFANAAEMREALEEAAKGEAQPRFHPVAARIFGARGEPLGQAAAIELSRGGVFLCTETSPPAIFTRLEIALSLPGGEVLCPCEVVRHVGEAQAHAWHMPAGFGVQFLELPRPVRDAIRVATASAQGARV